MMEQSNFQILIDFREQNRLNVDWKMKLGLLLPNQGVVFGAVTVAELVEMAERADGMGVFDAIFVGDNLLA